LDAAGEDPELLTVLQTPLNVYVCPSDIGQILNHDPDHGRDRRPSNSSGDQIAMANANYVAANHSGDGVATREGMGSTGMFPQNRRGLPFSAILDGLSSTIMAGERVWGYRKGGNPHYHRSANHYIHRSNGWDIRHHNRGTGDSLACSRPGITPFSTRTTTSTQSNGDFAWNVRGAFSSLHPGGGNFCFGDGSVQFISETVNSTTLNRLVHRDDGNLPGMF